MEAPLRDLRLFVARQHYAKTLAPRYTGPRGGGAPVTSSPHAPPKQGNVAAGLQHFITRHSAAARAFAFDVAAGAPVALMNISNSRNHGGGRVYVDKSPCLASSACKNSGYWVVNLNRRLLVEEMEALQGIPLGRLCWPSGMQRSLYSAMIGKGFTSRRHPAHRAAAAENDWEAASVVAWRMGR